MLRLEKLQEPNEEGDKYSFSVRGIVTEKGRGGVKGVNVKFECIGPGNYREIENHGTEEKGLTPEVKFTVERPGVYTVVLSTDDDEKHGRSSVIFTVKRSKLLPDHIVFTAIGLTLLFEVVTENNIPVPDQKFMVIDQDTGKPVETVKGKTEGNTGKTGVARWKGKIPGNRMSITLIARSLSSPHLESKNVTLTRGL